MNTTQIPLFTRRFVTGLGADVHAGMVAIGRLVSQAAARCFSPTYLPRPFELAFGLHAALPRITDSFGTAAGPRSRTYQPVRDPGRASMLPTF